MRYWISFGHRDQLVNAVARVNPDTFEAHLMSAATDFEWSDWPDLRRLAQEPSDWDEVNSTEANFYATALATGKPARARQPAHPIAGQWFRTKD